LAEDGTNFWYFGGQAEEDINLAESTACPFTKAFDIIAVSDIALYPLRDEALAGK
jgi:hypothetical protein